MFALCPCRCLPCFLRGSLSLCLTVFLCLVTLAAPQFWRPQQHSRLCHLASCNAATSPRESHTAASVRAATMRNNAECPTAKGMPSTLLMHQTPMAELLGARDMWGFCHDKNSPRVFRETGGQLANTHLIKHSTSMLLNTSKHEQLHMKYGKFDSMRSLPYGACIPVSLAKLTT